MDKAVEIMRIVRIPPVGKLVVEIAGKRYFTLAEMDDPKMRQLFLAALGEMIVSAGGYQTVVDAGFAPPLAIPPSLSQLQTGRPDAPTPARPPSLEEQQAAFLTSLEQGGIPESPSADNTSSRPSFFRRRPRAKQLEEPLLPTLNIAAELNAILQRHLANDPELRKQTIKIEGGSRGGVRINVNGQYYEDVAHVPDPVVRMAIKLATREWEESQSSRSVE